MLSLKEENDQFPKYCGLKRTGTMDCVQNIRQKDCFMSSYTKLRLRLDGMLFAITTCFTRLAVGLKCMYIGESNENLKFVIKIRNFAPLSCKLVSVLQTVQNGL